MSLFERIRKGCPELTGRFSPTLDLYILRIFLGVYVVNLLSFCLIFVLIDLVENLDNFNRQADSLGELFSLMVRYYGINLPIIFCQVLGPIVCLASGLFTLTMLQRSNELIPILANGRSYRRLFMPVLFAACLVSAGTFLIQDRWLPWLIRPCSFRSSRCANVSVTWKCCGASTWAFKNRSSSSLSVPRGRERAPYCDAVTASRNPPAVGLSLTVGTSCTRM